MIKLVVHSTHGDPYYVGLNGLEVLDFAGDIVYVSPDQLQATPYRCAVIVLIFDLHHILWPSVTRDVNDLPDIQKRGHDDRVLENLTREPYDTFNDRLACRRPCS